MSDAKGTIGALVAGLALGCAVQAVSILSEPKNNAPRESQRIEVIIEQDGKPFRVPVAKETDLYYYPEDNNPALLCVYSTKTATLTMAVEHGIIYSPSASAWPRLQAACASRKYDTTQSTPSIPKQSPAPTPASPYVRV